MSAAGEDWMSCTLKLGPLKLMLLDVSRAHFQAKAEGDIFVELPEERREEGKCGKLLYNLYGTRCAAQG